jgi:selenocysteine-specific elongation factor
MQPVIIGTAGHIDHGKTALVKALTGTDTDRLKEEKERGITIELGYAFLSDRIAFIDVPGHERFIKNMVAGASTVDFALLVVAADDGVMPQTREHLDILELLGVPKGVIAVTKCDLADPEWVDLVEEDLRALVAGTFLEGGPVLRVDSLSGRGIPELKDALSLLAEEKSPPGSSALFRLPVDRVFTVKGFGTVVTGSALSGVVSIDDRLTLLPKGTEVRVRGIESQGERRTSAAAGMRVALNLPQISVEEIARGDVLATPNQLRPTFMLDVECRMLKTSPTPLEQRQRVRVHIGTKEVMARAVILEAERIDPGETGFVQLRLEAMTAQQRLDRFVIRRYSPQITIGGGRILDANPRKHRKRHGREVVGTLTQLADDRVVHTVETLLKKEQVLTRDELAARSGLSPEQVEEVVDLLNAKGTLMELEAKGQSYLCAGALFADFTEKVTGVLHDYHQKHPLRAGMKRSEVLGRFKKAMPDFLLKHFAALALTEGVLASPGNDVLALGDFEVVLSTSQRQTLERLNGDLEAAGFQPPEVGELSPRERASEARQILELMVDRGDVVLLEGKLPFHREVIARGVSLLSSAFAAHDTLTMSDFRKLLDTTRKYAVPLLNYYDNQGYTTRRGDVRVKGPRL